MIVGYLHVQFMAKSPCPLCQRGERKTLGDLSEQIMYTNLMWYYLVSSSRGRSCTTDLRKHRLHLGQPIHHVQGTVQRKSPRYLYLALILPQARVTQGSASPGRRRQQTALNTSEAVVVSSCLILALALKASAIMCIWPRHGRFLPTSILSGKRHPTRCTPGQRGCVMVSMRANRPSSFTTLSPRAKAGRIASASRIGPSP